MIVLHIDCDSVVCYEMMKFANKVNSVFTIEFFPFQTEYDIFNNKRNIVRVGAICVQK